MTGYISQSTITFVNDQHALLAAMLLQLQMLTQHIFAMICFLSQVLRHEHAERLLSMLQVMSSLPQQQLNKHSCFIAARMLDDDLLHSLLRCNLLTAGELESTVCQVVWRTAL